MAKSEPTMLGRWLRYSRGNRSQTDVAARIGMEQAEWSKWETGKRKEAKPDQIKAFAFAVEVPVHTVALAYAGIWPLDAEDGAKVPPRDGKEIDAALRIMDEFEIPPDIEEGESVFMKHLFRGVRAAEAEIAARRQSRSVALPDLAAVPDHPPGADRESQDRHRAG